MPISLKFKSFAEFTKLFSTKPIKYIKRQYKDIQVFGTARQYANVSDDILERYTPFRRLSKKPCSLSDPKYFITKFEQESANELPLLWTKMTDKQKVDFIVKNRYERRVSNKIMNDISKSRVERSFILSTDGKIKYSGTYNSSTHCPVPQDLANNSITIHNHPIQFVGNSLWNYSELPQVNANSRPFSNSDIVNCLYRNAKKTYVVDSKGIKFQFIPNYNIPDQMGRDFYISELDNDLQKISMQSFERNNNIESALSQHYTGVVKRLKQDGHSFKILNFFDFNKW